MKSLREEIDLKEADLLRIQREADKSLEYARGVDAKKVKWLSDLEEARTEKARIQDLARSYATTIDDLNHQIIGLKSRLSQIGNEPLSETKSSPGRNLHAAGTVSLEKRLLALDAENQALRSELAQLKNMKLTEVPPAKTAAAMTERVNAENGNLPDKTPVQATELKDDLKLIKGIGAVLESKLNQLGIFNFSQIMAFDEETAEKINEAIGFFPGRILRDDWIGQAARLYQVKEENPDALHPKAIFPKNPNDLKIVEGIGPKIESILKNAGLNTLHDLAESKEDKLREILSNAGDAYRIHDPSSWPVQAALAAEGDWDKLKDYQDHLLGGREVV
jgi:predicted flap endonuclease-1-like 5' DNA nuclease